MRFIAVLSLTLGCFIIAAACSGGENGGNGMACSPGAEHCTCLSNDQCNTGLSCVSKVCVQQAGSTGGGSGSGGSSAGGGSGDSGRGGVGGNAGGGAGGATSAGGTGGGLDSGTSGAAGASGGAGGPDSGDSGGTCGNTQTGPQNCGECSRVCKSAAPIFRACPVGGCCQAGHCIPYLAGCIRQASGFSTCTSYCASLGETCVQGGCRANNTWEAWEANSDSCELYGTVLSTSGNESCDSPIPWQATVGKVRCCCSDTRP